jgi:hypothetical protein
VAATDVVSRQAVLQADEALTQHFQGVAAAEAEARAAAMQAMGAAMNAANDVAAAEAKKKHSKYNAEAVRTGIDVWTAAAKTSSQFPLPAGSVDAALDWKAINAAEVRGSVDRPGRVRSTLVMVARQAGLVDPYADDAMAGQLSEQLGAAYAALAPLRAETDLGSALQRFDEIYTRRITTAPQTEKSQQEAGSIVAAAQPERSQEAAGCTKDTDCKGDRICEHGTCTSPAATLPADTPGPQRGHERGAKPGAGSTPRTPPKNCFPPYTTDSSGIKHAKRECL